MGRELYESTGYVKDIFSLLNHLENIHDLLLISKI
jgi:hypothetical protein